MLGRSLQLRQSGVRPRTLESSYGCRRGPDCHRPIRRSPTLYAGKHIQMTKRFLISLFTLCSAVLAQTDSGSIRVFVADSSQAQIGDATVRLTNTATSVA